jgi:hypothetical protein
MKRLLGALVFFIIPTGLGGSSAWAQLDPTKVLVGTWEGSLPKYLPIGEFTLIIESVTPQDGGWVAMGSFGPKEGNVRPPRTYPVSQVSQRGGDIIVEFRAGQNPVRLKLVGERKLEGTMNVVGGLSGTTNHGFKFEKVEPKADDVK